MAKFFRSGSNYQDVSLGVSTSHFISSSCLKCKKVKNSKNVKISPPLAHIEGMVQKYFSFLNLIFSSFPPFWAKSTLNTIFPRMWSPLIYIYIYILCALQTCINHTRWYRRYLKHCISETTFFTYLLVKQTTKRLKLLRLHDLADRLLTVKSVSFCHLDEVTSFFVIWKVRKRFIV